MSSFFVTVVLWLRGLSNLKLKTSVAGNMFVASCVSLFGLENSKTENRF